MAREEIPFVAQDGAGTALDGTAYVYGRGTTTEASVYPTEVGGTALAQPLTISGGRIEGWVDSGSYDIAITTSNGSYTQAWTVPGASGGGGSSVYCVASVEALAGFNPVATSPTTFKYPFDVILEQSGGFGIDDNAITIPEPGWYEIFWAFDTYDVFFGTSNITEVIFHVQTFSPNDGSGDVGAQTLSIANGGGNAGTNSLWDNPAYVQGSSAGKLADYISFNGWIDGYEYESSVPIRPAVTDVWLGGRSSYEYHVLLKKAF
jgi:hypothetical protein